MYEDAYICALEEVMADDRFLEEKVWRAVRARSGYLSYECMEQVIALFRDIVKDPDKYYFELKGYDSEADIQEQLDNTGAIG